MNVTEVYIYNYISLKSIDCSFINSIETGDRGVEIENKIVQKPITITCNRIKQFVNSKKKKKKFIPRTKSRANQERENVYFFFLKETNYNHMQQNKIVRQLKKIKNKIHTPNQEPCKSRERERIVFFFLKKKKSMECIK